VEFGLAHADDGGAEGGGGIGWTCSAGGEGGSRGETEVSGGGRGMKVIEERGCSGMTDGRGG
jgi:hypothetical protein